MKKLFNFLKTILEKYYNFIIFFLCLLIIIALFDKALAAGLIFLALLIGVTFWILSKAGFKNKNLYVFLVVTLIIHLASVLFIYYAHFQPFGGGAGDFVSYHKTAVLVSQHFKQGNFSLEGIQIYHYYPVIIGIVYTFTLPEMIIGQLFGVWLAVLALLFVYLIVIEIGGSEKWAFIIGLIVNIYPSYLFYTSLLLKDTLVIPCVLAGMLLCLKLIKNFQWRIFFIFYIVLAILMHFRFYLAYTLLFTFIFCWMLFGKPKLKKKFIYALIVIPLLGFLPYISTGGGFYGINAFKEYFNPEIINYYQKEAYKLSVQQPSNQPFLPENQTQSFTQLLSESNIGYDSTWERENVDFRKEPFKFLKENIKSLIYVLLGPFPWQIIKTRHLFALFETIPWYFLLFFIGEGIWGSIKARKKSILPVILFSLIFLVLMSVFFNNYGIITRIRIPVFISLLCLIPLGLKDHEKE